ncbi:hypothetical protein HD842_001716 [Massilia aurea]|uniref:Uncharacterized protein n=1 Tax=Massilia aurea TaxID=373040 RepID=A0A7W9WZB5_9BURK|nr:hypothetical protein [Massilia aurea]MBB6133605.1 hypothetical protein [Massilia aurea]
MTRFNSSAVVHRTGAALVFALACNLMASAPGQACSVPPVEQVVTPEQQIAMATDVSVARVVEAIPSPLRSGSGRQSVDYTFEVQQRILGLPEQRFTISGARGMTRPPPSSGDHSDAAFWERGGGRLYNDADCVLRPDFIVGESYLIFRGKPATWRSFEHIATVRGRPDPNDRWLSYVMEKLSDVQSGSSLRP